MTMPSPAGAGDESRAPQFVCRLDDLVPSAQRLRAPVVAPSLRLEDAGADGDKVVFVTHARTGLELAYRASRGALGATETLRPGHALAPAEPTARQQQLVAAGIVVDAAADGAHDDVTAWRARFAVNRFVVIRELIPPGYAAALGRFYRAARAAGVIETSRGTRPIAEADESEAMLVDLAERTLPLFADIVAAPLTPSAPYLGFYERGAALERHTDVAGLDITAGLLIEQTTTAPWPLQLATRDGTVAVALGPGDCVLYGGRELPHWFDPFAGELSIFHYYHFAIGGHAG